RFLDLGKASELERQPCDLVEIVQETVTLLRPQCRHANIDLRCPPLPGPADAPVLVVGDRSQLGHLVLNVLTNAIEAAGPGGWAEIRSRIADCGLRNEEVPSSSSQSAVRNPQSAIIEVVDSGPGPAPEVAAR